ncbi:MAG: HIRAN domain-containing protein [Pseudomonadota bacterium]|uniref:HIRAN domain-containing protein n=1 Tax=Phenylobacterium sp. TaxID=1871053 RepID=UPI0025F74E35|nr:HIRAN domain-containing protein [Phenylobacterium sp.]MBT9471703.1 hypothetical protein [Phenylobacterium sp.]
MELVLLTTLALGIAVFLMLRPRSSPSPALSAAEPPHLVHLSEDGDHETDVVGESHYQDALIAICGGRTREGHELECQATLRLEPENPSDSNAVGVWIEGRKVGHLTRQLAATFSAVARRNGASEATCAALIVGGWDRGDSVGYFGVRLDLFNEEEMDGEPE